MRRFMKAIAALLVGALQIAIWLQWELGMFSAVEIAKMPELPEILNRAGLPLLTVLLVIMIPYRMKEVLRKEG